VTETRTGFPDWTGGGRVPDVIFINTYGVAFGPAQANVGPFHVGIRTHFGMYVRAIDHPMRVTINYAGGPGISDTLGIHTIHLATNMDYMAQLPILGPYLYINFSTTVSPNSYDLVLWSASVSFRPNKNAPTGSILISDDTTVVGAGANITRAATRLYSGPATLRVRQVTGAFAAQLQAVADTGAVTNITTITQAAGQEAWELLYLPPMPVQIVFTNNDAAAHTPFIYLRADPGTYGT
jgi:hypothetical protein